MDWRFEYVDLEKIRELMEKSDGWEEAKQREFYSYLLEEKDNFFGSSFGDLFLDLYKEKLGVSDLEIIRSKRRHAPAPEEKPRVRRVWKIFPALLLTVAVSAGSIWVYRKIEAQDAKKHLQTLQETLTRDAAGADAVQNADRANAPAGPAGKNDTQDGADAVQNSAQADAQNGGAAAVQNSAGAGAQQASEEPPPVLEEYRELASQYPELFGWLTIPDSGINYPVMQPLTDKDYYLHHNYEGTPDDEGALFADPASSAWPMDDNLVIYGHNMKNGHMFGELKNYGTESYFLSHPRILFHTLYEKAEYEVVTVVQTHIKDETEDGFRYYQFFNYETEEAFSECVDFIQENQIYDVENKLQYGDQLLMLSTCDYAEDNGRFVVIARKKEV